jgi:hypothetical protein
MAKYPPGTFFVALREFEGTAQKGDTFYVSKISTEFIYLKGIGEKIVRIRFKGFSSLDKFEEVLPSTATEQKSRRVVDARHLFAKKRYHQEYKWTPSPEMKEAIVYATIR